MKRHRPDGTVVFHIKATDMGVLIEIIRDGAKIFGEEFPPHVAAELGELGRDLVQAAAAAIRRMRAALDRGEP